MRLKKQGFTLIELLVVISIITLLSSIISVNIVSARHRAENVKRRVIFVDYVIALTLYFNDYGVLPSTPVLGRPYCLGDYPDDQCGYDHPQLIYTETPSLSSELSPYLSGIRQTAKLVEISYPAQNIKTYKGPTYACTDNGSLQSPSVIGPCVRGNISFMLEGYGLTIPPSCPLGSTVLSYNGDHTCSLNLPL